MKGSDRPSAINELWWRKLSTPKFSTPTVKLHGLTTATVASKEKCRSLIKRKDRGEKRQREEKIEGRKDTWTNAEESIHIIRKISFHQTSQGL